MTRARTVATDQALGECFTPIAYVNPNEAPVTLTLFLLLSR